MKTTSPSHPSLTEYMRQLEREARSLPRGQREELLSEIRDHLDSGIGPDATAADVRNLLDDLGRPADIVAAVHPDTAPTRRGARETFGLILLVTGLPPVFGWLVGVGLVLSSRLWTARQKLLGILVWPLGLVGVGGVGLATAPMSNRISCDLTADGALVAGSCMNHEAGASGAIILLAVAVAIATSLAVGAYLYSVAGRNANAQG
jgi:hypothetical protein